jgi:hypothetical protein
LCAFSVSLTTTVFSQRSIRWFEASPRRAAPKGQPSSLAQHSIKELAYITLTLLSAFVAHNLVRSARASVPIPSDRIRVLVGGHPN